MGLLIALVYTALGAVGGTLMARKLPLTRQRIVGAIIAFTGAILIAARPTNPPAMFYGAAALAVIIGSFVMISVLQRHTATPRT